MKNPESNIKLLKNIALISAVFAFILCLLIIVNFAQTKRVDPLNVTTMNALTERLAQNPQDEKLKNEIRELDLLARKAFFTNQWQVRIGGYLLLISILVLIICIKTIDSLQPKTLQLPQSKGNAFWEVGQLKQKWVAYTGIGIVILSLLLVVLTHNDLGKNLKQAIANNDTKNASDKVADVVKNDKNLDESKTIENKDTTATDEKKTDAPPTYSELIKNCPAFRGVGGLGVDYHKNIPTSWDGKSGKNILWKTAIPLHGFNSPIYWDDQIFISGANANKREVYCFDAKTGKILWTVKVEGIAGSPAKSPETTNDTGNAAPTLTTDGRYVFAVFANGDLIALDMKGNKVWAKNLGVPQNHYGYSSSLIMYRDLLIVQYDQKGSANLMALAAKTGDVVWTKSRSVKISWASPIVANTGKRTEIMLAADPYIAGYNPANGEELWKMDCISGEVGPSLAYADGVVFSVNEYSKLAAIQIGDAPKQLWEDTEYMSDIPSPVATAQYLFLATSYGTVVCYDSKTGTKHWFHEFNNQTWSSPILVEGKIYLMDKKGIMHIFKADKTFSSVAEPQLGEGSVCTPAFADGKIFIRGDKNLYCVGK